jgi:hypothetical protein
MPAPRWPSRSAGVVRSRALEGAPRGKGPCQTEGIPGCNIPCVRLSRGPCGTLPRLPSPTQLRASAVARVRGRDRNVRGSARTHRDGKTTPAAMDTTPNVRPAEANRSDVKQAIPWREWAQAHDEPGTDEARVLVSRREMAEVGPTHRAPRSSTSRKADRVQEVLAKGAPQGVLTHATVASRGENGARRRAILSVTRDKRGSTAGATRSGATRRKAFRSSRTSPARNGYGAVLVTRVNPATRTARCVPGSSCSPAHGSGRRCPRRRRGTSDIGEVHGKGCSSRRGAGGPLLDAP